MKTKFLKFAVAVFLLIGGVVCPAHGQKMQAKGVVLSSSDSEPIIGVGVVVKGTKIGTTTDLDGRFTIDIPSPLKTLVFSFVGVKTKELEAQPEMQVYMEVLSEQLEEVVVTGYGTFKKSAYAGSASTVKTAALQDIPAVSFVDIMQGAAPGVQITSGSGQPGAVMSVNIRGMGSFNAVNTPLYVIDGIPIISGNVSSSGSDAGLDIMSTINTSDIESLTVIKDAAAASLYGSRAANGVILITTKKGKKGKPVFSFKSDWGYSDFAMEYRPVMGGQERRDVIHEGLVAEGLLYKNYSEEDAAAYADREIVKYAPIPWNGFTDWNSVLFKRGSHRNHEFSASGASDKMKYYSSLSYLDQDGIAVRSSFKRISGRLNVDYMPTSKLTLGANVLFSSVRQDVYPEGTSYASPFYSSRNAVVPSDPVYNEDGTWNRDFIRNEDRNPALSATYNFSFEDIYRTFNTVYATYELLQDLNFKSTLSYDLTSTKSKAWSDPRTSEGVKTGGSLSRGFSEFRKLVWANNLNYKKTIAEHHSFDALIGYETDEVSSDFLEGGKKNFASPDKTEISNGMQISSLSGHIRQSRMVSYLSRVNYDYKHKYFLGGSYRLDGSSRLKDNSRWGSFWSVSGAWRAIEEEFLVPVRSVLTDLRLRASYGVNGTLPIDYYGYMGLSSLTNGYDQQPGIVQSQIKNDDLSWETNYNFNVGLDFGFLDRINVTVEYYARDTKSLLIDRPISMTTGFSSYLMNIGRVKNQGIELEIRTVNISTKDFNWTTAFNLSHNKNKVVALDGIQTELVRGSQIRKVGLPYRTFYLREFAGINPETGLAQYYTNEMDNNGNYIKDITENPGKANYIPIKSADPKVAGGLINNLRYKMFDLGFTFSYSLGGYSYDNWALKTESGGKDPKANIPIYYKDRWRQPGDQTNIERYIVNNKYPMHSYENSRRLHKTDFLRLRNFTFGVTLPSHWVQKARLNKVRLYMAGNNLWTKAAYRFYDPEAVNGGTAIWGTPPLKTLTFGANINF